MTSAASVTTGVSGTRRFSLLRDARLLAPLRALLRHPQGLAGSIMVGFLVLAAVLAPALTWHDPVDQIRGNRLVGPNSDFLFGTDEFSRDIYARVLFGLRTSLLVATLSTLAGAAIGAFIGYVAGFGSSVLDALLSRFMDALLAFPAVVIAIAIATALGSGNLSVGAAIAIFNVPVFARLARASALAERERDYVVAARALGASGSRQLFWHVVPNTVPPLLVQFAFAVAFAVLLEAGLSFLGMGTTPPDPSIGAMLNSSRVFLRDAPWYALFPGGVIVALLIGLNFLADAINDLSDPRSRRR